MHTILLSIFSAIFFPVAIASAIPDDYVYETSLDTRSAAPEPIGPLIAVGAKIAAKIAAKKAAKIAAQKAARKAAQEAAKRAAREAAKRAGREGMRQGQERLNQKRGLSVRDIEFLEFLLADQEMM